MWETAGVKREKYSKVDIKPLRKKFLLINTDITGIPVKYSGKTFNTNLVNMVIKPTS